MRKSVILVILIIYILSIVIVGFLGIKLKVYDENFYVEKITCTNTEARPVRGKDDECLIIISYRENLQYQLQFDVQPANATNKNLSYTSLNTNIATVNELGVVSFTSPGDVEVLVSTTDGSRLKYSVIFIVG
ncbi:MAG: Ig-like domain-containing protein [Clostridia bacterium]|nr:Ig-like domain-containing protein [Clostridia bacterium]